MIFNNGVIYEVMNVVKLRKNNGKEVWEYDLPSIIESLYIYIYKVTRSQKDLSQDQ